MRNSVRSAVIDAPRPAPVRSQRRARASISARFSRRADDDGGGDDDDDDDDLLSESGEQPHDEASEAAFTEGRAPAAATSGLRSCVRG